MEEGGAAAHGKMLRCTDGDGCDGDHAANGSCALQVKVCLESGAAPGCGRDIAADMNLSPDPRLGALAAAIEDMKSQMSPGASEACTPVASVSVPTRGQPGSKLALQLLQRTKGPRKRVALSCRAPRRVGARATFATIQKKIFNTTCATPACHGAFAVSGGLSLAAGASYGNLVGVPASNPVAAGSSELRVVPGNPDASFFYEKLLGNVTLGEGVRMPLVGPSLSPKALALIRRWIAAGAPETAPF